MWKCKTCGCQNPDTCTACRMCKAASPNNTTLNFTKPGNVTPGYTERSRFGHESAPKFCGRCGRQLEPGLTVCRYCASTEESRKSHSSTKSNNSVMVIVAAAIVCIAAILLVPRLLGGYHQPSQFAQEPQTAQGPQNVQNIPTNAPEQQPQAEQSSNSKELYYAYFAEYFGWDNKLDEPMLLNATNKYNVYLADLTHDGEDEMIVVDNTMSMDGIVLTVFTCTNNSVVAIHTYESAFDPREKTFGLYESGGSTYLFICCDGMTMEGGKAYYDVVSLTSDGEHNYLLSDSYSVTLDSETTEVSDVYYSLLKKMDELKQQSYIVFDCKEDYVRQSDPATVLG